ncbi:hypothetical protein [Candidatus Williamhamiltonella defendens]|uniref:hypothetical protein n=1 Tax=Candidatus Williamhamiltonella defendens TaxID=138072 RepID=UPI001F285BD1|nr:hypothetical protein [Candidatus Hamiltonella defensa]
MEQTGCDSLSQRDYRKLSGGEQKRVQISCALAQRRKGMQIVWHRMILRRPLVDG